MHLKTILEGGAGGLVVGLDQHTNTGSKSEALSFYPLPLSPNFLYFVNFRVTLFFQQY